MRYWIVLSLGLTTLGLCTPAARAQQWGGVIIRPLGPPQQPFGVGVDEPLRWPHSVGTPAVVSVCWEQLPTQAYQDLVKGSIRATWSKVAGIDFVGWTPCPAKPQGVRVKIADEPEQTAILGNAIAGVPGGVLLNPFMINSTPSRWCTRSEENQLECMRTAAVHEFGHVLGLAHEQNRSDRPTDCHEPSQGPSGDVILTPWDASSVMNYCNPTLRKNGWHLSDGDIISAQKMYGARQ